jgi:oxygen-independent coproporphyrinogen-3 oxidase
MPASQPLEPTDIGLREPGFGIYVHWPFCRAKCPYCDFNVHIREGIDDRSWLELLMTELDHFHDQTERTIVTSLYFGGGTPSLMAPATVERLIEHVASRWPVANDIEINLEANPNDWRRFDGFRGAGVTRLSLGVQSFDDDALRFLGRDHSADTARVALDNARALFAEVSCDLIYALPGQNADEWRQALRTNISRLPMHLSLYQLTVEPGTAFHRARAAGEFESVDGDDAADFYAVSQEICEAADMPAYEVSNHARLGHECCHNLTYWRGGDYVGVGPGAHGRLTLDGIRTATRQYRNPETWGDTVRRRGDGTEARDSLERQSEVEELFILGLRAVEGISRVRFQERFGTDVEDACATTELADLANAGLIECDDAGLRVTATGRPVLNAIIGRLIT